MGSGRLGAVYWEPAVYSALLADSAAAALSIAGRRRYASKLSPIPLLLVVLGALLLVRYEPFAEEALYPLLFVSGLLLATRIPRTEDPVRLLAGTFSVYAGVLAALQAVNSVVTIDPRLVLHVEVALAALSLAAGLASGYVLSGERWGLALAGLLSALGLAALGYGFLMDTGLGAVLRGDTLVLSMLALLVASTGGLAYEPRLLYGLLAAAAGAAGMALYDRVPYIECSGPGCGAIGLAAWLVFLVVVLPYAALRLREALRASVSENLPLEAVLNERVLLLGAAVILLIACVSVPRNVDFSQVVPVAAMVLAAAAVGGGLLGLAVPVAAGALAWLAHGAWLGAAAASLAGLALMSVRRRVARRAFLASMLVALLAAGYIGAGWLPHSVEARLEPVGLDGLAPIAKPSEEVVHDYFLLYIGVKNQSVLYAILAPKLGKEEALKMARFAHAIAVAARHRGISDPYPLERIELPQEMPSLLLRVDGVSVAVPQSVILSGRSYVSEKPLLEGLNLLRLIVPGNVTRQLRLDYLALVSNPNFTDGDALRYTLYTAMAISWVEKNSLNMTAELVFKALEGNLTVKPVTGVITESVLPLGVLWLALYVAALLAAPVTALIASRRD